MKRIKGRKEEVIQFVYYLDSVKAFYELPFLLLHAIQNLWAFQRSINPLYELLCNFYISIHTLTLTVITSMVSKYTKMILQHLQVYFPFHPLY